MTPCETEPVAPPARFATAVRVAGGDLEHRLSIRDHVIHQVRRLRDHAPRAA